MTIFKFFKKKEGESKETTNSAFGVSLVDVVVLAWKNLDADSLLPYLTDDFHYYSVWVSNTLSGKADYINYLRGKFETISKSGDLPIVDIFNEKGVDRPRLSQQGLGTEAVLDILENNGKISKILMRPICNISVIAENEWIFFAQAYQDILPRCYQVAGASIQEYVSTKGLSHPNFAWIQADLLSPSFQHLCFRYLSDIYSVIIGIHGFRSNDGTDDDRIVVSKQDYDNLLRECEHNNLIPCIIPVAAHPQIPILGGLHIVHAISGEPITIDDKVMKEQVPMSKWEINSMGVQTVLQYLRKENCKINSYCDVVGIEPQIWFEKNGRASYVIVRSIPIGKRKEKFGINHKLLLRLAEYDGYFADIQFTSSSPILKDENGNVVPLSKRDGDEDIWMWRGDGFYCNFTGLQPIEKSIADNDFIEVYDKPSYDIK